MILMYCFYLFTAVGPILCGDIYEDVNNNIRLIDSAEDFTLFNCANNSLGNFALPSRTLSVKKDIRFSECFIPNEFRISKLINHFRINVTKLTFNSSPSNPVFKVII